MRYGRIAALVALAGLAGCGGQEAESPTPAPETAPEPKSAPMDQDELMKMWHSLLTDASPDNLDVFTATGVARRLAELGPNGLDPLLDVLEDPETEPLGRVLAVISLTPHVTPKMAPQLIEMTKTAQNVYARASAAHLLGLIDTPEARGRMEELMADDAWRVQVAAALALIDAEYPKALPRIDALWNDSRMTPPDKEQLILVIPQRLANEHLHVYREGLLNTKINQSARRHAATMLGRFGGRKAIAALKQAAENDPDERVRQVAQKALEAVQARTKAGNTGPADANQAPATGAPAQEADDTHAPPEPGY